MEELEVKAITKRDVVGRPELGKKEFIVAIQEAMLLEKPIPLIQICVNKGVTSSQVQFWIEHDKYFAKCVQLLEDRIAAWVDMNFFECVEKKSAPALIYYKKEHFYWKSKADKKAKTVKENKKSDLDRLMGKIEENSDAGKES